ncbi:hypothetical protein OMD46_20220 [Pseudomonas sp. MDMC_285]|nr:hypothetical protein [Pseudomonas sp. MDMC_285]
MSEKAPNKALRFTGYEGRRPGDYSHSVPSKPWQFPPTLLASSPHCGYIHYQSNGQPSPTGQKADFPPAWLAA